MTKEPNDSISSDANHNATHAVDYWQIVRNRFGIILLAFFLIFFTACVITYILPKKYESQCKVQINRSAQQNIIFPGKSVPQVEPMSPKFFETQFEIIHSQKNLYQVIDQLELEREWSMPKDSCYQLLLNDLETEVIKSTEMMTIRFAHTDARWAQRIAQAVAVAYKNRRIKEELDRGARLISSLGHEIETQEMEVERSLTALNEIIRDRGIIDPEGNLGGGGSGAFRTENGIVDTATRDVFLTEKQIKEIKRQITEITEMKDNELIKIGTMLGVGTQEFTALRSRLRDEELSRDSLLSSELYGKGHPTIRSANTRITQLGVRVAEEAVNIKDSLGVRLKLAEQNLADVKTGEKAATKVAITKRLSLSEYQHAKHTYQRGLNILEEMKLTSYKAKTERKISRDVVTLHEDAQIADDWTRPNVKLNLIIGAVLGIGFGIGLAFFLEYLDTSVKSLEDVERFLQTPVLAVVPKDVGVLHNQTGLSPDAEAYRILRTNIEFSRKSADANCITIVSGAAGEGKSTTLVNLAYICAQGGYNTLMIDADLRRPKLHTFFDINNSVGLTNYLTTELQLEDVILQSPVENLYFMPSGILPADAAGILNSRRMAELISDVKSRFDLVLIDSPPILGVSDASVLASEADLTLVVIQHRKLPRNMLLRVKQAIEKVGGTLLGVVLNNVDVASDSQYQYYTSYYTYYAPDPVQASSSRQRPAEPKFPAPAAKVDQEF